MKIIDCEQRSEAWFKARMGIPTCSEFETVMAKGSGKGRRTYMYKLAGERLNGSPMENYTNAFMERGIRMEQEAREAYSIVASAEVTRVGFILNEKARCGGSPDALIGKKGMLEIKTAMPHILLDILERDEFPAEHVAQCQGNLWVAERDWIDIAIYNGDKNPEMPDAPGLPLFVKRAKRDEAYIKKLAAEVAQFNDELDKIVKKYGGK